MHLKVVILSRLSKSNLWPGDLCWDRSSWPAGLNSFPLLSFSLMSFSVHNTVPFSPLWLRLRLDLPRICGNWEYVFLLPHLVHPCPPLCYARTNLGRRPENMSPHAHRLQCVDSIDHQLMCLFMIPLTESGQRSATHWCSRSSGPVLNFTHKRNQKKKSAFFEWCSWASFKGSTVLLSSSSSRRIRGSRNTDESLVEDSLSYTVLVYEGVKSKFLLFYQKVNFCTTF